MDKISLLSIALSLASSCETSEDEAKKVLNGNKISVSPAPG